MPEYSQIIYCLQKKLTHFSLEISVVCVKSSLYKINCFKYLLIYFFETNCLKNETRKKFEQYQVYVLNCFKYFVTKFLEKIRQEKLYQVFMHNFSVSKWLDIYKDFKTKSSLCRKMFQYVHNVYMKALVKSVLFLFSHLLTRKSSTIF